MSTTINSASTGAERFIKIDVDNFGVNKNVMIFAEIPEVDVYFNISVNKYELIAAVAKETGSLLVEPKRVELATWEWTRLTGIDLPNYGELSEGTSAGNLRKAAAHYLALAAEKEVEEAVQAEEVARMSSAVESLYYESLDDMTKDELVEALVKAGLTVKKDV